MPFLTTVLSDQKTVLVFTKIDKLDTLAEETVYTEMNVYSVNQDGFNFQVAKFKKVSTELANIQVSKSTTKPDTYFLSVGDNSFRVGP